jgi:energy-coupling factor transport system ATP-binding protein
MINNPLPLVVNDLSFRYRGRDDFAIQNINFEVQPGQVILIAVEQEGCGDVLRLTHSF